MTPRTVIAIAAAGLALSSCMVQKDFGGTHAAAAPPPAEASTQLLGPNGEIRGTVTLSQQPSGTHVAARVEGLPAGSYAIHIHAVGQCIAPTFASAGGHFNPDGHQHGSLNPAGPHMGDMPNLIVGSDGSGRLDFDRPGLRLKDGPTPLLDADGAAVVVHAGPDDYKTDPSGNSGGRIACGVLAAH